MMFFVDFKNYNIYCVIQVNNFRWVDVFVSLIYFRNVYKIFYVVFDFYEVIVISQVSYLIVDFSIFWVM